MFKAMYQSREQHIDDRLSKKGSINSPHYQGSLAKSTNFNYKADGVILKDTSHKSIINYTETEFLSTRGKNEFRQSSTVDRNRIFPPLSRQFFPAFEM